MPAQPSSLPGTPGAVQASSAAENAPKPSCRELLIALSNAVYGYNMGEPTEALRLAIVDCIDNTADDPKATALRRLLATAEHCQREEIAPHTETISAGYVSTICREALKGGN